MSNLNEAGKTGRLELSKEDFEDPGTMLAVNKYLNDSFDRYEQETRDIGIAYGIELEYAACIFYLRTRARWTPEFEQELVRMGKAGEPVPNMNEWPEGATNGRKKIEEVIKRIEEKYAREQRRRN